MNSSEYEQTPSPILQPSVLADDITYEANSSSDISINDEILSAPLQEKTSFSILQASSSQFGNTSQSYGEGLDSNLEITHKKRRGKAWALTSGYGQAISIGNGERKLKCLIQNCQKVFESPNSSTSGFNSHLKHAHEFKRSNDQDENEFIFGLPVTKMTDEMLKDYPKYLQTYIHVTSDEFRQLIVDAYRASALKL